MKQWVIAYQYWQIVFCKKSQQETSAAPDGYIVMDDSNLSFCFETLVAKRQNIWVWCENDMRDLVKYCMNAYIYIKAAGGIVRDAESGQKRLLIYRNQHWDMAKGKVELGETIRQAAVREVEEETGLTISRSGRLIRKTYHIYDLYGGWHLKQTTWYEMWDSGETAIQTQQEEGITHAEWFNLQEWKEKLSDSYSMMKLLANS